MLAHEPRTTTSNNTANTTNGDAVEVTLLQGNDWPLVITPRDPSASMLGLEPVLKELAQRHLERTGALLFRGFAPQSVEAFKQFAACFAGPLLGYEFGSTPRTQVSQGVYTSTEYPAHQHIPLHNEQSYSRDWPMRIWFNCVTPSTQGGETPIADSRKIYRKIDPALRKRFEERRLMYVRNFGNGLDVPWAKVFDTSDRATVERYCKSHGIACEWKPDGELRTRQICQASARHPRTAELVWFNQAHLFHVSTLDPEAREVLFEVIGKEDLPRNVYYGDGSDIEESALQHIHGVLDEAKVAFPWQGGDVLMLDNMLTAHGRSPYKGDRKVVVAMAEGYTAPDHLF